ncbi:MAG: 4Fe-4S dicluster domain-containing protein [Thermodesulfobacteriota bacterium]
MASKAYDKSFREEVYENVDSGEEIKLCMQCGVCGITCPLRDEMTYGPRQIWSLIRAGKREEVMNCSDIMLCTSCYACKVRCPRGVKVIDVMHGLARYALRQGIVPRKETSKFGKVFWDCIAKTGRIDETDVPMRYTMTAGPIHGIFNALEMMDIGRALLSHKRMKFKVAPGVPPAKKIKGIRGLKKMLKKAAAMSPGKES